MECEIQDTGYKYGGGALNPSEQASTVREGIKLHRQSRIGMMRGSLKWFLAHRPASKKGTLLRSAPFVLVPVVGL